MPDKIKTPEEILAEEKQVLLADNIEESKARARRDITQADSEIAYAQGQITLQEGRRQQAQKLLDELEARYPTVVPPEE